MFNPTLPDKSRSEGLPRRQGRMGSIYIYLYLFKRIYFKVCVPASGRKKGMEGGRKNLGRKFLALYIRAGPLQTLYDQHATLLHRSTIISHEPHFQLTLFGLPSTQDHYRPNYVSSPKPFFMCYSHPSNREYDHLRGNSSIYTANARSS